jgi:hypothetical protein
MISQLPKDQERVQGRCHCATSNPIDTQNGNYWTKVADLSVSTPDPDLTWTRVYASQAISDTSGVVGYGWQTPYTARLILPGMAGGESGLINVLTAETNRERFIDRGNGQYEAYPGVFGTLIRVGDVFTQTLRDQLAEPDNQGAVRYPEPPRAGHRHAGHRHRLPV